MGRDRLDAGVGRLIVGSRFQPRLTYRDCLVGLLAGTLIASACNQTPNRATSSTSPAGTTASTSRTSTTPGPAGAEGVLMLTESGSGPPTYDLVVISANGVVSRKTTALVPMVGGHLPRFSVAGRSVYFIDGNTHLKALRPDGSVTAIAELPGGPLDRIVFAVSPDETQIALSVLHYGAGCTSPTQICTTTSLRVGALDLHDLHEIFNGPVVDYPIGWHQGKIVMAVASSGSVQNNGEVNPYFADALHLVDPANGNRLFSTSPACDPPSTIQGPVNSIGLICQQTSGNLTFFYLHGWDGSTRELFRQVPGGVPSAVPPLVLAPHGENAAGALAANHQINILDAGGIRENTVATGTPAGWFDDNHLLFFEGPCCTNLTQPGVLVIGPSGSVESAVNIVGVTGAADPYAPFFVPIPTNLT